MSILRVAKLPNTPVLYFRYIDCYANSAHALGAAELARGQCDSLSDSLSDGSAKGAARVLGARAQRPRGAVTAWFVLGGSNAVGVGAMYFVWGSFGSRIVVVALITPAEQGAFHAKNEDMR